MANNAYYFSHDSNARNDEKILMLRAEHGWEGYGIYWALIELMFESTETSLKHGKTKGIAAGHNIDITLLESVINTCITEGLFESDGTCYWSESLRRRKQVLLELKDKKSKAGKKGMAKRWASDDEEEPEPYHSYNTVITENNKGKERKGKEIKEINKEIGEKRKRFVPPTQEEVKSYCTERKNTVDPERFVDFYESKGWMVGKNKMKDWKAAVRSWEKKEDPKQPAKKKTDFHLGESRGKEYTNEELEKMLLKKG